MEFQFRGIWLPADIILKIKEGKINTTEVVLLSIIEALVDPDGVGCYATNGYFAGLLGLSERRVRSIIQRLEGMELLVREDSGGKRYLETAWSRVKGGGQKRPPPRSKTTTPPLPTVKAYNKGDNVPFFDDLKKPIKKTTPSNHDLECAEDLHTVVVHQGSHIHSWSKNKWANEFRLLRQELNNDTKRIDKALNYYIKHTGKKGLPDVHNAAQFRRHFNWIEDAMKKTATDVDVSTVTITELGAEVARRVRHLGWPKGSGDQVPYCVQISLNNYEAFCRRFYQFMLLLREDKTKISHPKRKLQRMQYLAEYLHKRFSAPAHFIEEIWFARVHKNVYRWEEWNGNLKTFIFKEDSLVFGTFCSDLTVEFCHEAHRWTELKEALDAG